MASRRSAVLCGPGGGELVVVDVRDGDSVSLQHRHGRLDHRRWPAHIGVAACQAPLKPGDDIGDQAGLAVPGSRRGLRERRYEAEAWQSLVERSQLVEETQLLDAPGAVVVDGPAGHASF